MTSGKRLAVAVGIGLLTVFGSLSAAHAQYRGQRPYYGAPPPVPRGVYRSGLVARAARSGAAASTRPNCGICCGGAGMVEASHRRHAEPAPRADGRLSGAGHPYWTTGTATARPTTASTTIALQYWVTDIIWLKGGIGFGNMQSSTRTHRA